MRTHSVALCFESVMTCLAALFFDGSKPDEMYAYISVDGHSCNGHSCCSLLSLRTSIGK